MNKNIVIPKNDVFFYGLSLKSRDATDVRSDIFSNILMKYLTTLKPVSSRLYRTAGDFKYEYSYTFVPSKPLSWRVIKNKRIVEDIELLTGGRYCLNYYDDNGRDVKRIIFNDQNRWVKTNYYNSLYGENLVCSLIPKELNAETVIMQYVTGNPYPITLFPCPTASNSEVLASVLERIPTPEVTALTNYGLLYYACKETINIFSQVLKEEEEKYKEAHKPPVFNTEEDVAGGFCFDVESFDTTKSLESRFDLSEAQELTEEDEVSTVSDQPVISEVEEPALEEPKADDTTATHEYSIDDEIAKAIKMISEATSIEVNQDLVFTDSSEEIEIEPEVDEIHQKPETNDIDSTIVIMNNSALTEITEPLKEADLSDETLAPEVEEETSVNDDTADVVVSPVIFDDIEEEKETSTVSEDIDSADLLNMDDEAIDDYVSSLIDSLLQDAQSTVNEYNVSKDDAFAAGSTELDNKDVSKQSDLSELADEDTADTVIESNGAQYFYYGELNDSGERTGLGRTLMADGKIAYDGEYLDDMRHGKGSFYYKDGSLCFYGDWQENMRNGFGIGISSETGIIHTGNWSDNKPSGIGVRFDKNGNFMYLDSASEKTNGGIRIVGFGDNSIFVEVWNEKTLKTVKKEISLDDLMY